MAVLLIASAALAAPAEAVDEPVRIELEGTAGFTLEQLRQALGARLPQDAVPGTLRVVGRADGSIELSWQSRRRVVDLGGDTGPAAARVAALLAADLLSPLGLPGDWPGARPPTPAATPPPAPTPPNVATATGMRATGMRLTLSYQAWAGAMAGPLLQGVALAAGWEHQHLRLQAAAGYLAGQGNSMVDVTAWPMRVGAGAGVAFGSLLANLVMVPYRTAGVAQVTRALVGVGLEGEAHIPLGAGFRLEAGAGWELYVNRRVEIWGGPLQLFAMPRSAFRFGLGLSWGRAR